jgi:2-polyprenyl-3-methyl-5-hydroxy-6-metoxy-1,4-benzoquinol methylase
MYGSADILQTYCSADYEEHPYFLYSKNDIEKLSKERFKNYYRALENVESVIGVGSLLDVGCGSGAFLYIAKKRGWKVSGIEISPGLCNACERNTDITVMNCSFEEANLQENHYDLVAFWDIIEHVLNPSYCIEKARSLLRPGGVALFCTPNEDSLLAKVGWALYKFTGHSYRYPAFALHPPTHTYFFSKKSLARLLENSGFEIVVYYSQEAFFEHSPLATRTQKISISMIEKIAKPFGACYELVILAKC